MKEFDLFGKKTVEEFDDDAGVNSYSSTYILRSPLFPALNLDVLALPGRTVKLDAVTPFSPDRGYQISKEDYLLKTRVSKILAAQEALFEDIDNKIAPLFLRVGTSLGYTLGERGLMSSESVIPLTVDEFVKVINQFRLWFLSRGDRRWYCSTNSALISLKMDTNKNF